MSDSEEKDPSHTPENGEGDSVSAGGPSVDDSSKKKKKKSKKADDDEGDGAGGEKMDMDTLCKSIAHLSSTTSGPSTVIDLSSQRSKSAGSSAEHAFWGTQPMRKPDGNTCPNLFCVDFGPCQTCHLFAVNRMTCCICFRAPGMRWADRRSRQGDKAGAIQPSSRFRVVHLQHRR